MRHLTVNERALLDAARPGERSILRDLFKHLDARLVTRGGALEVSGDPCAAPPLATVPQPEPLFSRSEAA